MIDESHVRELRDARHDGAALVFVQGSARVVDTPSGVEEDARGALVVITKAELVDRLGPAPADHEVRDLAYVLTDMVGKLGA
ncbi:hypothetical protein [Streptomyces sp. NPDC006193]|uniref:hypothetical protein n=1 Tax=Streptomyces sp. NPDC006193 TaxID=3155717 RepID=UPI0033BC283D